MIFKKGSRKDIKGLRQLGIKAWSEYPKMLDKENGATMMKTLEAESTYTDLFDISECLVCESNESLIIGMAFLVPSGHPSDIYQSEWCHLRFISVDPDYRGNAIGQKLTEWCIEWAVQNGEEAMALHTSEVMVGARHIYEKLGFQILKEIPMRHGLRYWLYLLDLKKVSKKAK